MRKWLRVVAALAGFYAGWVWGKRQVEKTRWAQQWSREDLEDQAGLAPADSGPWWTMSRALEEEGLVPPPV